MKRNLSIKTRLLLPFFILNLLLVIIVGYVTYYESERQKAGFIDKQFTNMSIELQDLEILGKKLAQSATLIASNPDVILAMKKKDRNQLLKLAASFLRLLDSIDNCYYYVHFHLPHAISFLRIWKPDQYGDDISSFREMVVEAQKNLKPLWGIELGRVGLAIRGISPILDQKKLLGSVEIFCNLTDVINLHNGNNNSIKGIYFSPTINLFACPYKVVKNPTNFKGKFIPWKSLPPFYHKMLSSKFLFRALYEKTIFTKDDIVFFGMPVYDFSHKPIAVYVTCLSCPSFFLQNFYRNLLIVLLILFPINLFYIFVIHHEISLPLQIFNTQLNLLKQMVGQKKFYPYRIYCGKTYPFYFS